MDDGLPEVSVLVVSWQTRVALSACLRALGAQRGVLLRAVVVDNASQDGSADMVRQEFPDVVLLEQSQNLGYTRATNLGLARCPGRYVLLCNPDCRPEPETASVLVKFLENNQQAAAAAPRLYGDDGALQDFCYRFPGLLIAAACFTTAGYRIDHLLGGRARRWHARADLRRETRPALVDHASAACLMVRRELLGDGLEPTMPLFFSDLELSYRLRRGGWLMYYLPAATAHHSQGAALRALTADQTRHELRRGLLRFYEMHRPRSRWLLVVMLAIDALMRATFRRLSTGRTLEVRAEMNSLRVAIRNLPMGAVPWVE
ncbi:MAG: glycosyltransferase family 2 protein [Candidatus Dormibacteria bacterium]